MRRASPVLFALLAVGVAGLVVAPAQARARHHRHVVSAQALTVHKRPFTDSGNVVPVGSQSHYATDGQGDHRSFPGVAGYRYGGETLPGRWENPGAGPLFSF